MAKQQAKAQLTLAGAGEYDGLVSRISSLLEQGRRATVSASNAILTATYWNVGRQIVEYEQGGKARAEYGEVLLKRLGHDLSVRLGKGFSRSNLQQMRVFYLGWEICQTVSGKLQARVKCPTVSGKSDGEKAQTPSAESGAEKLQTLSAKSGHKKLQTPSAKSQPTIRTKLRLIHRFLFSMHSRCRGRTTSA